jgi:hypothetical protein
MSPIFIVVAVVVVIYNVWLFTKGGRKTPRFLGGGDPAPTLPRPEPTPGSWSVPSKGARLSPRAAYRLLVAGWLGVTPVCFALLVILSQAFPGQTVSDQPPAIFLPLIPAGMAMLIVGWLLRTNDQGVRDRLAQSWLDRANRNIGAPAASRFGGVIATIMGSALLAGGLVAAGATIAAAV